MKFEESENIEKAYLEFLASKAPETYKQQLRQAHQLANQEILGQTFPINLLENQYGTYYNDNLKLGNGKLFYIWQRPIDTEKIAVIQQLYKATNQKKYIDFGLIGLTKAIEFPKELKTIPHFWIPPFILERYIEKIPIKEDSYLILVNKYGKVIEYITWNVDLASVNEIVDFTAENYSSRVYSTLRNHSIKKHIIKFKDNEK